MITTVPFETIGNYRNILWRKPIPVFSLVPTEEDFSISTKTVNFGKSDPRICLDFQIVIISISKSDRGFSVIHEFSFEEQWTGYYFGTFESWGEMIIFVKSVMDKQVNLLKSHLTKVDRLVW